MSTEDGRTDGRTQNYSPLQLPSGTIKHFNKKNLGIVKHTFNLNSTLLRDASMFVLEGIIKIKEVKIPQVLVESDPNAAFYIVVYNKG